MSGQEDAFSNIRLLALDLDGVLTDGKIYYSDQGDEIKCFDIQDGLGIVRLRKSGIPTIIITGKKSKINRIRAKELGVYSLCEGVTDKKNRLQQVARKLKVDASQVCFVGDDLIDAEAMQWSGCAVAVSNAVSKVKDIADYVTSKSGGNGAVREVCDLILEASGADTDASGLKQP